jgi:hypothetical protein
MEAISNPTLRESNSCNSTRARQGAIGAARLQRLAVQQQVIARRGEY